MWSHFYVCVWLSFEFDLHVVFPMLLYDMYFEVCEFIFTMLSAYKGLYVCAFTTFLSLASSVCVCMFDNFWDLCIYNSFVMIKNLMLIFLSLMFLCLQNLICSHVLMEIGCDLMVVYNVYYLVLLYIYVFRMNVDAILYVI